MPLRSFFLKDHIIDAFRNMKLRIRLSQIIAVYHSLIVFS